MADQWLSIVEYARTFAVSDMTIRRRIKTGRIKAVLKEGKYYIPVGPNGEILEEPIEVAPVKAAAVAMPKQAMPDPEPIVHYASEQGLRPGASFKTLPQSISQNLLRSEHSLVDTNSLLQFCDKTVTRINSIEKHLQDSFQSRIQSLESQLKLKDATISQLKQQAEDLQILVKLMERR
ncbi:MAG: hypothetical protein EOP07_11375 [Proteobacteria bacterium]|nr:MAG: hypothetical protein EOP07_11375 [Pseudomonadota bacterium]